MRENFWKTLHCIKIASSVNIIYLCQVSRVAGLPVIGFTEKIKITTQVQNFPARRQGDGTLCHDKDCITSDASISASTKLRFHSTIKKFRESMKRSFQATVTTEIN